MGFLVACAEVQEGVAHRPAKLYTFDREKYGQFLNEGDVFDL
jgi:8-oxo-dGTP diphosphatase